MSDVVIPRTKVLQLSGGRSITVREELNHGQHTAMLARMYHEVEDAQGEVKLRRDLVRASDATTIAYLLDWNLTDPSGDKLDIRGLPPSELQDVLDNLRQRTVAEIRRAVLAHHDANEAEADDQKKIDGDGASSPQTLQSVA